MRFTTFVSSGWGEGVIFELRSQVMVFCHWCFVPKWVLAGLQLLRCEIGLTNFSPCKEFYLEFVLLRRHSIRVTPFVLHVTLVVHHYI